MGVRRRTEEEMKFLERLWVEAGGKGIERFLQTYPKYVTDFNTLTKLKYDVDSLARTAYVYNAKRKKPNVKPSSVYGLGIKSEYLLVTFDGQVNGFETKEQLIEAVKASKIVGGMLVFAKIPMEVNLNVKLGGVK